MGLKSFIIQKAIDRRKQAHPFDSEAAERYTLPPDADRSQNNSFYFSAHTVDGASLLFRNAYRGEGRTELWVAYKDRDGNAWVNPKQEYDNGEKTGLELTCVKAADEWAFSFSGQMARVALDKRLHAEPTDTLDMTVFSGTFKATAPIFEFSRHFDSKPIARALSKEKLKRGFAQNLAAAHQVHYEQSGKLDVKMKVGAGREIVYTDVPAMRDHSYGKRDWAFMDRHVWIVALLEDGGDLNYNCVRYPIVRELQTGYFIKGDKRLCTDYYTSMDEYEKTDDVPLEIESHVVMADKSTFVVKAKKELEFQFAFEDSVYQFHESISTFDINGKKARGIVEFGYHKDRSRWDR
ncbi:MAG: hypothetical protein LBH24_04060 [Clostridiales bacterium]|jgi:hypothetical protein|nr:hypothetical protein [Clostridiales bacterium]